MAKLAVRAFGSVRDLVGAREMEIQVETGSTIRHALRVLIEKCGKALEDYILDSGTKELRPHIRALLNGQNIDLLEGLETKVNEGDIIAIFPPAGGGEVWSAYSAVSFG